MDQKNGAVNAKTWKLWDPSSTRMKVVSRPVWQTFLTLYDLPMSRIQGVTTFGWRTALGENNASEIEDTLDTFPQCPAGGSSLKRNLASQLCS